MGLDVKTEGVAGTDFGYVPPKAKISKELVGIDLSSQRVKLVHMRVSGSRMTVEHVASRPFDENATNEISRFLSQAKREFKIKTSNAICVIPAKLLITKNVDIPSRDADEIDKIVDLQAGRFTPYSRNEVVIDYLSMETPEQYYTNVLLLILHRKTFDRYISILERAGFEVDRVVVSSESMATAYAQMGNTSSAEDPVGGIHIAEDSSDLTVVDKQKLVFLRSVPVGADHFKKNKEEALSEFLKQLNKSMIAFQNQGIGRPIKVLIITGLINGMDFLQNEVRQSVPYIFASNIGIKIVPYESYFHFTPAASEELSADPTISFFEVMSSLYGLPTNKVNLVPKEVRMKRNVREGSKNALAIGILVMTIFLMVSLFLAVKILLKSHFSTKLETIDDHLSKQALVLEQISTKSRFLRSLLENRGLGMFIFQKIAALTGAEVYLSEFRFDKEQNKIVIAGTADSMSRVFNFVTELEKSNYFSSVNTNETKSRRAGGRDVADFEIECVLREGI